MGKQRGYTTVGQRLAMAGVIGAAIAWVGTLTAAPVPGPSDNNAQSVKPAAELPVNTNILARIYQSAYARLGRGDVSGAVSAFQIVQDAAPLLPEANYALALATILADFSKRESALPLVARASATDPGNPLGTVVTVLADPQSSILRQDGALYLTATGADRLRAAAQQARANATKGNNTGYLADFLNSMESTSDKAFPARYVNFKRMTGQGGIIRLKNSDVSFGQIFGVQVSDARFSPYEQNLISRLQDGLRSLESNQDNLSRVRGRIQQLRARLDSNDATERMVAMSNLDKLLSDLDDVIVGNQSTIASLKIIVDNVPVDQELAKKKDELRKEEEKIVAVRNVGRAVEQELNLKKAAVSQVERERLQKVKEVSDAQRKLNDVEKKLASKESELASSNQTTAQAERTVQERGQQLAVLAASEEALRKQQKSAAQLESIRQQKDEAAEQLNRLQAEIQRAETSKRGNLATLRGQEGELSARLAALQADVAAGEKARQQADQVKQELASLQARKGGLENDMRSEEANLARVRAERDGVQREVEAMRRDQEKQIGERSRLAQYAKEVDFGRYFALVIGNNEYKLWRKLDTAVNDARDVADVLEKKYGFKVRLLTNATRGQIVNALDDYVDELGPNDNLLVYYAGHGIVDQGGSGYWVPVDADAYVEGRTLRTENLVRHQDIIATVQRLKAKQVILVADSCFAGGLAAIASAAVPASAPTQQFAMRGFKLLQQDGNVPVAAVQGVVAQADQPEELIAMQHWASRAARVVLTSGGNEPVVDQLTSSDKHSVFAQAFLASLQRNKGLLKSIELTNTVQDQVVGKIGGALKRRGASGPGFTAQTPSSSNLMGYNGEFLFVARN
jgi:hypothetical protein